MNWKTVLALAFSASALMLLADAPNEPIKNPGMPVNELATGKVETVFDFVDSKGYRFIAYKVTYQGTSIIAIDPTSKSHYSVGDSLSFLASRQDLTSYPARSNKVLTFIVSDYRPNP